MQLAHQNGWGFQSDQGDKVVHYCATHCREMDATPFRPHLRPSAGMNGATDLTNLLDDVVVPAKSVQKPPIPPPIDMRVADLESLAAKLGRGTELFRKK